MPPVDVSDAFAPRTEVAMRHSRNHRRPGSLRALMNRTGPTCTGDLVSVCVVVLTAHALGMEWPRLETPVMPFGLWLVAAWVGGLSALRWLRSRPPSSVEASLADRVASTWRSLVCRSVEALERLADAFGWEADRRRALADRLSSVVDRVQRRPEPLRIGLSVPPHVADLVTASKGTLAVEWTAVAPGDTEAATRWGMDAVVRASGDGIPMVLSMPERRDHEAAWYDWSRPRPLTYAAVFPGRVDPAIVTLPAADEVTAADGDLLTALIEAAAALSRLPGRLSLVDRLLGRHPDPRAARTALARLSEMVLTTRGASAALRGTAASVASAWLAGAEDVDPGLRRRVAEVAAALLPDDPLVALRLAAARFAALDDDAAFAAIVDAERVVRASEPAPVTNHLAFLQGELDLGLPTPTTLGRVASGICLVHASSPEETLPHLRDDLLDDLRFSAWLVGRDQDRAVLIEVFRILERARGTRVMPRAA